MKDTYTLTGLTSDDIASLRVAIDDRCDILESHLSALDAMHADPCSPTRQTLLDALGRLRGIHRKTGEALQRSRI